MFGKQNAPSSKALRRKPEQPSPRGMLRSYPTFFAKTETCQLLQRTADKQIRWCRLLTIYSLYAQNPPDCRGGEQTAQTCARAWLRQLPPTSEVSCLLPVERCLLLKAGSVVSLGPSEREFEQRRLDQWRLPAIQEQRSLSPEAWRGILLAFLIMAASIAAIVAGVRLLHYFRF